MSQGRHYGNKLQLTWLRRTNATTAMLCSHTQYRIQCPHMWYGDPTKALPHAGYITQRQECKDIVLQKAQAMG